MLPDLKACVRFAGEISFKLRIRQCFGQSSLPGLCTAALNVKDWSVIQVAQERDACNEGLPVVSDVGDNRISLQIQAPGNEEEQSNVFSKKEEVKEAGQNEGDIKYLRLTSARASA